MSDGSIYATSITVFRFKILSPYHCHQVDNLKLYVTTYDDLMVQNID